ncbi:hypothetical protein [uncultured Salegentibacter sp.]|uniref:hypothetical protein n=1 Tax=uncultured Salegentibacter sp. TaxID=259320 RepID=UPI0030DA5CEC
MKKLVVILGIIFIGLSSFTSVIDKPDKVLVKQIYAMLDDLPLEIEEELLVEVRLINELNRIKVLFVEAEDPLVRKLIRKRLDKNTLAIPFKVKGAYRLPIRIKV